MIAKYKLFTTPTCPSCPAVKDHMSKQELKGELIDASQPENREQIGQYGITSVPTVLFLDDDGNVLHMAQSIKQVDRVLNDEH